MRNLASTGTKYGNLRRTGPILREQVTGIIEAESGGLGDEAAQ
jgi:hypothetical protein